MSDNAKPFRIAIAGLGTVGTGVVKIIQNNAELLSQRSGRTIEIVNIMARDPSKDRGIDTSSYSWSDNAEDLLADDIDCLVELIGGHEGIAKECVKAAIDKGIHVVTANKALLAHHGYDLAVAAEGNNVEIKYEAAVAGGIPIIKTLKEGLAANEIQSVFGILNGTCNYILTEMQQTGRDFSDVLEEAQEKGYAEADPTFDVDGIDTAHKIALLTSIAFGVKPDLDNLPTTGIRHITADDLVYAEELGFRIKLFGICRMVAGQLVKTVEPCLVPMSSTISAVDGVLNAVAIEGDFVGPSLSVGFGAGEGATASSVMADVVELARGVSLPTFGIPANDLQDAQWGDEGEIEARFYLRLVVVDQPGVLADISATMRDNNVSMEAVLQRGDDKNDNEPVSVVITSHTVKQSNIIKAISEISEKQELTEDPCLIRIEDMS